MSVEVDETSHENRQPPSPRPPTFFTESDRESEDEDVEETKPRDVELIQNTRFTTLKAVVSGHDVRDALLNYRESSKLKTAFTNVLAGWVNPKTGKHKNPNTN